MRHEDALAMEAELRSKQVILQAGAAPSARRALDQWREVVFTVSQARRALPYVARIARDAAEAFGVVQRCRAALGAATAPARASHRAQICEERDAALQRLNVAIDECNLLGAHLLDIAAGRVSFLARVHGRPACLLWRLGEGVDGAWHDLADR